MKPKLEACSVSYSYHTMEGETPALSNISFFINPGEFLAVVGPSGCGKSTLLSLLSGLLQPEEGSILIDGIPICDSPATIGYMFQKDHLFEWRTIYRTGDPDKAKRHRPKRAERNASLLWFRRL